MGHIYTLSEVLEGKIPTSESFERAHLMACKELQELVDSDLLEAALFYGSNLTGEFSPGSDLDICIAYNAKNLFPLKKKLHQLKRKVYDQTHVPLQIKPHIILNESEWGIHKIPRFFLSYLEHCASRHNLVLRKGGRSSFPFPQDFSLETSFIDLPSSGPALDEEGEIILQLNEWLADISETSVSRDPNDPSYCKYLQRLLSHTIFSALDIIHMNNPLKSEPPYYPGKKQYRFPTVKGKPPTNKQIYWLYRESHSIELAEPLLRAIELTEKYRSFLGNCPKKPHPSQIVLPMGLPPTETIKLEKDYVGLLREIESFESQARDFIAYSLFLIADLVKGKERIPVHYTYQETSKDNSSD